MSDRAEVREGIAGTLTALIGGGIVVESWSIPTVFGFNYGPGFFPGLIGLGLLVAGLVHITTVVMRRAPLSSPVEAGTSRSDGPAVAERWWRPAIVLLIMLLMTIIMSRLGFHLTAPVALGLLFVLFGLSWKFAIVTAIVMTLLMDAIFRALLLVPLPWGVLTPWTGVLAWRF